MKRTARGRLVPGTCYRTCLAAPRASWALILDGDRTGFQRGGDGGHILEPEVLHEVVDIFLLRKRYGVSIAISRHPNPKGPALLPLTGYLVLLAEHRCHTVYLLTGSHSRFVVDPKGADWPSRSFPNCRCGIRRDPSDTTRK